MQNSSFNNHSPSTPSFKQDYKSIHKFKPILERLQFHQGDSHKSKKQKLNILTQQIQKHRYFDFVKKPLIKHQKNQQSSLPSLIVQLKSQSNPEKSEGSQIKDQKMKRSNLNEAENKGKKNKRKQSQIQLKPNHYQQKQKQSYKNSMIISLIQEQIDRNILYMQEMQKNILSEIKKRRVTYDSKQHKAASLILQKSLNKQKKQSSTLLPEIKRIEPTQKKYQKIIISPEKILQVSRKRKQQQEKQLILKQQLREIKNSLYKQEDLNKGWELSSLQNAQIVLHQNFIDESERIVQI